MRSFSIFQPIQFIQPVQRVQAVQLAQLVQLMHLVQRVYPVHLVQPPLFVHPVHHGREHMHLRRLAWGLKGISVEAAQIVKEVQPLQDVQDARKLLPASIWICQHHSGLHINMNIQVNFNMINNIYIHMLSSNNCY